jgi:hypothetical protein
MEIVFSRVSRYLYDVYLESKDLFDEHDCNVVGVNSLNIHVTNDDCTSHDNDVSYKNVDFCGVNWECIWTPKREDRFCKKHKYLETKKLQERLDDCAEIFNFSRHPYELCNECGHLNLQCYLFDDQIVSKNCDSLITLEHHKGLFFFWGMKK